MTSHGKSVRARNSRFNNAHKSTITAMENHKGMELESDQEEEVQAVENLVFEDNHHQTSTLARLNTLRKGGQFCDVKIEVDGQTISAHRVVLACTSTFLLELFTSDETVNQQHYKLANMDSDSFNILVKYAYTSRLEVPFDQVRLVYKTAMMLKVHAVAEACSKYLAQHLDLGNCLEIRAFANSHSDGELTIETDSFIQKNIADITQTSAINQFPFVQIDVLGVNEMDEERELQLCQLAVEWAERSLKDNTIEELSQHLHKLYMASDNSLRDCNDADDPGLSSSDEVQDYKKLSKKRQVLNAAISREQAMQCTSVPPEGAWMQKKGMRPHPHQNGQKETPQKGRSNRQYSLDRQPSQEAEWNVIARQHVDDRCCMCIVMLDNTMCKMSINLRTVAPSQANDTAPSENGSPSPMSSPRGSICGDKPFTLTPLARMSSARCAVSTAVLEDKLIALGGYDRGECLSTVEAFDLTTNAWEPMPEMTTQRGRFDVSQHEGCLYACGGSNGSHELKSTEYYDSSTDKWRPLPNMMSVRSSLGVTVMGGKVYAIGGWSGQSGLADCEAFDLTIKKWTPIAKLNTGRSQAGVTVFENNVIAVGGCDSWSSMNTVETYDPETNTWAYLPPMNTCRRGAGVIVFNNKLYVVGGSDGTSALQSCEIYDPETASWSFGPTMSIPRANVGVAVVRNRLFVVGGFSGKAFLDSIEYLMEDGSDWCSFVPIEV